MSASIRDAAVKTFLAALWCVCLYRAVTQSIVHDEALTYQLYIAGPISPIFSYFDANHHFLNTILMRLSAGIFGVSEWSLRLPALAAAALYFASAGRLARQLFPGTAASLLAVGLVTLNPFVLDFMVAARGYGMALALLAYGLATLLEAMRASQPAPRALARAGAALGLSVTANLVFVVPVLIIAATAAWLSRPVAAPETPPATKKERKRTARSGSARSHPAYFYLLGPLLGIGLVFFISSPLSLATADQFYAGAATLKESLRGMVSAAVAYKASLREASFTAWAVDGIAFVVAPAIPIGALVLGWLRRDAALLVLSVAALGSAAILLVAHLALGVRYPIDRTGFYFFLLVPLCLCGLASAAPQAGVRALCMAIGAAAIALFALQFNTSSFLTWEYDADTRSIVDRLAALPEVSTRPPGSVRVATSWQLEPSLNFYRDSRRLTRLRAFDRAPLSPGADYYIVIPADRDAIARFGLNPLQEWPRSGALLAAPPR